MNNKKKTYLLLAAVIGIWGVAGYKMFSAINPETPKVNLDHSAIHFNPKQIAPADTFSITVAERDPFLGTFTRPKTKTVPKKTTVKKVKIAPRMPSISYVGIIKKQESNQGIFVVNIDSNQHLLRKGEVADSVKLLSGTVKEIVVLVNKKKITIPIQ